MCAARGRGLQHQRSHTLFIFFSHSPSGSQPEPSSIMNPQPSRRTGADSMSPCRASAAQPGPTRRPASCPAFSGSPRAADPPARAGPGGPGRVPGVPDAGPWGRVRAGCGQVQLAGTSWCWPWLRRVSQQGTQVVLRQGCVSWTWPGAACRNLLVTVGVWGIWLGLLAGGPAMP